jgi:hypothetical protein
MLIGQAGAGGGNSLRLNIDICGAVAIVMRPYAAVYRTRGDNPRNWSTKRLCGWVVPSSSPRVRCSRCPRTATALLLAALVLPGNTGDSACGSWVLWRPRA